ncbi:hypothetical protein ANO11243_093890 [Dothideomycetidae sp. 11243]|nr:hypothetical protein ANO11243_093890 [fungal sp. No.11243]
MATSSHLEAEWTKLSGDDRLQRSSHGIAASGNTVAVFGGELVARQPRDNHLLLLSLDGKDTNVRTLQIANAPPPRVGAPLAELDGKLYLFSGRGGTAMAPIEENGAVWVYDFADSSWSLLGPSDSQRPVPPARSYHCTTSGEGLIFIHAGCPEQGRLSDLWSFEPATATWTQLPDAPGPPRGGPSIAYLDGSLYRMNGFDGKQEVGGALDHFDIKSGTWSTIHFAADGKTGPHPRSVGSLLALEVRGRPSLITMFGESDPSSLGHAGAGKMLDDVWVFDIATQKWSLVHQTDVTPQPRGWFTSTVDAQSSVLVVGGLGERNERVGDAWMLSVR